MAKIIFLDIDGVLNSFNFTLSKPDTVQTYRDPRKEIDPVALGVLKNIVGSIDAKIVITSTWRKEFSKDEFCNIMRDCGWTDFPLLGYTPVTMKNFRGEEVAQFLEEYVQDYELDTYVIVDDSNDYYLTSDLDASFRFNQPLVRVDPRVGFNYVDALGVFYYLDREHKLYKALKEEYLFKFEREQSYLYR